MNFLYTNQWLLAAATITVAAFMIATKIYFDLNDIQFRAVMDGRIKTALFSVPTLTIGLKSRPKNVRILIVYTILAVGFCFFSEPTTEKKADILLTVLSLWVVMRFLRYELFAWKRDIYLRLLNIHFQKKTEPENDEIEIFSEKELEKENQTFTDQEVRILIATDPLNQNGHKGIDTTDPEEIKIFSRETIYVLASSDLKFPGRIEEDESRSIFLADAIDTIKYINEDAKYLEMTLEDAVYWAKKAGWYKNIRFLIKNRDAMSYIDLSLDNERSDMICLRHSKKVEYLLTIRKKWKSIKDEEGRSRYLREQDLLWNPEVTETLADIKDLNKKGDQ